NDVFKNGKKDAKVEYFAKIKMHGAKEIRSELMVMPRPPAILNINEIDGPGSLSHDTKGVYVVKSFNREASQEEKDSLSWAVKINGKEIERFENVGDSFEYTPCAKYAGETITVHPFLRSPSDKLFIKTTVGQYLLYNGSELIWLDETHKEVGKWKACSSSDNADPAKENGPLPEGNWVVLQDARDQNMENSWWKELTVKKNPVIWADKNRVELVPFKETDTHGRVEKFYVFGGEDSNSSLRGINLAGDIVDFVDKFQKSGKNLVLLVNYSEVLVMPRELPSLNNKELHEAPMQTSEYGKQFIMKHEGFMAKPYNCSAGHATIGYGTLLHKGPVNEEDINKYGTGITKETAKAMFDKSIIKFEIALNKAVKVKLNQNQFDALMSWTYNFGEAQLNEKYTKWLRELNKGNYNIVPSEIQRWNKITKNGIKIESAGLTKRRKEESELFKENIW
ncbi:MAG: lysozyme, partial [Fibrobacter sp.]|nr:lysozyme [Fibrobacter sp.]